MFSPNPLRRIDHVQLAMPAGEEEAARKFYGVVLSLTELPKPPELAARGGVWFRSGEVLIHLGVDPEFHAAKKAHPAFSCTDYKGLVKRLESQDIAVTVDPLPYGGKVHCYVNDPFGNRIELIEG
ncbi:MAG: VOC family protein [Candidatus Tumulicola sp.]